MKQIVSSTLLDAMRDDPFFDPNVFDTRGLHPGFGPTTQENDGFDVPLISDSPSKLETLKYAVRDPEILKELAANQNRTSDEDAVLKHFTQNPSFSFYFGDWQVQTKYERGAWHCIAINEADGERKKFTLGGHDKYDKDGVMAHCSRYLVPKKPWRELTEEQLIVVSRIASGGNLQAMESAVMTYLNYALPDIDRDVSYEKAYQPLCDSMCWYVFRHAHVGIDDMAENWMRDRLGDRAVTINSLCGVYELWQHEQNKHSRSLLFNPPEPEPETPESVQESLENLSDEALADLRTRTLRLATRR
jgi:hypothetical protein